MKKLLVSILLLGTITLNGITAYGYEFDANYYARKYPDVVAVVGNDPTALYNHYISNGEKEGRYMSQAEETDYFLKGTMKEKQTDVQAPLVTQEVSPSTTTETTIESSQSVITDPNLLTDVEIISVPYSTYVDVDITNQTVTYFEDGAAKIQSPCVSGNESLKRSTPRGTFKISQHMTNKYLIGPTWKSYVNYWMRFTSDGCGLHDASWRSSFGSDIYKTNGSHGCVNLPYDAAKALYDVTTIGTIVVVHD